MIQSTCQKSFYIQFEDIHGGRMGSSWRTPALIHVLALAARNICLGLILWSSYWPISDSWNSLNNLLLQTTSFVLGTVLRFLQGLKLYNRTRTLWSRYHPHFKDDRIEVQVNKQSTKYTQKVTHLGVYPKVLDSRCRIQPANYSPLFPSHPPLYFWLYSKLPLCIFLFY